MKKTILAAAAATALALGASGAAAEGELLIYNWTDYTAPDLIEKFEKETGISVTLDTYDSNETLLAKLKSGGGGYDIVVPTHNFIPILIEEGLIPFPFAEGSFNTRLEVISDMPRGKVVWRFDDTDMARAKEVLGDNACIMGNVPASLTDTGTPDDVRAYCKNLIDVAGKGGGFILSTGSSMDMAREENVRAMLDFSKEYGVYG